VKTKKIDVKEKKGKLVFESDNMKLEFKNKINISRYLEFINEIFAEIIIARQKINNKKTMNKIQKHISWN